MLPPVRWYSTRLTFTSSEALASSVVVPDRVAPFDGMTIEVVGGIFSSPYAYRLLSLDPT